MATTHLAVTLELTPRSLRALERCCSIREAELAEYVAASLTRFNTLPADQTPSPRELDAALQHCARQRQPPLQRTLILTLERATLNKLCTRAARQRMPVQRYVLCAVLYELAGDDMQRRAQQASLSADEPAFVLLPPAEIVPVSWELAQAVL